MAILRSCYGGGQLLHDHGLGEVDEGFANAGEVVGGADAGQEEQARGVDSAGAEDGFGAGGEGVLGARVQGEVYPGRCAVGDVDFAGPGIGQNGKIWSLLVAIEKRA